LVMDAGQCCSVLCCYLAILILAVA
jgi:hypothetical protein